MKNIILVITVISFLYGCATTSSVISSGQIYKGMNKTNAQKVLFTTYPNDDPFLPDGGEQYYEDKKKEILWGYGKKVYYVFKDVTTPQTCGAFICNYGNGTLESWHYSLSAALATVGTKKKAVKKTAPSTKSATKSTSQGSSGSAFFVTQKGHIVTNYHVVKGCNTNPKIKYKNKDIDTKIIAKDQLLDLALLKADLTNTKFITLADEKPKKLQRIIASGYPFGEYISDDLKFTSGIVSSLKGPRDDSTLVQVDAALNPGNSGGPIVDEESGELVAVSVMGMKKSISEGQNFGIKTNSVKNFLDANQVKIPSSWGSFKKVDVAKLLEDSTLYTYCR
jgi:S1-C subfamily serine protease